MGARVISISEYTYIRGVKEMDKFANLDLRKDEVYLQAEKNDIRREMIGGYLRVLTNQIN